MSLDRAFEVDELLLKETTSIVTGASDPSVALVDRPIGSIYLRANGELWQKVGSAPNAWTQLGLTQEEIEDIAGGLTTAGAQTNVTVTYDDANNKIDYSVATATDAVLGVASFNSTEFSVTSGAVAIVALDGGSF